MPLFVRKKSVMAAGENSIERQAITETAIWKIKTPL